MEFSSKCDQIRRKLRIWSHLVEKSLMENFIFCAEEVIPDIYSIMLLQKCESQQIYKETPLQLRPHNFFFLTR